jgi:uncharacterized protein YgiB involved in biofilm formation
MEPRDRSSPLARYRNRADVARARCAAGRRKAYWASFRPALLTIFGLLLLLIAGQWSAKPTEQRLKIYNSVEACRAEQPPEDCAKAFADAEQEQAKSAPRLASREVCEAQYGSCAALHDGTGDWFVPAMAGFMLGHALGTGGVASVVSQPVYVDRGGTAYSGVGPIGSYRSRCAVNPDDPYCRGGGGSGGGGGFVYSSGVGGGGSSSSSRVWSSKSYTVESVRTSVMRGGFGSSASSAPPSSMGVASAPNATSSSSVTRGGFGITASLHSVGA